MAIKEYVDRCDHCGITTDIDTVLRLCSNCRSAYREGEKDTKKRVVGLITGIRNAYLNGVTTDISVALAGLLKLVEEDGYSTWPEKKEGN